MLKNKHFSNDRNRKIIRRILAYMVCVAIVCSSSLSNVKAVISHNYSMTEIWNDGKYVDEIPMNSAITISSKEELLYFLDFLNAKTVKKHNLTVGVTFLQTADIKFSDYDYRFDKDHKMCGAWLADELMFTIDYNGKFYTDFSKTTELSERDDKIRQAIWPEEKENYFYGIFDGQNHSIKGFIAKNHSIKGSIPKKKGSFIYSMDYSGAEMKNLVIEEALDLSQDGFFVVADNWGKVDYCKMKNCISMNVVSDNESANMSIVRVNHEYGGVISNCTVSGAEIYESRFINYNELRYPTFDYYIGGIASRSSGRIINCEVDAGISFLEEVPQYTRCETSIGGIVNDAWGGEISGCKAKLRLLQANNREIQSLGGIVGRTSRSEKNGEVVAVCVKNSCSEVFVENGYYISAFGGIVGAEGSYGSRWIEDIYPVEISNCKSTGSVPMNGENFGGIIGEGTNINEVTVKDSFSDIVFHKATDGKQKVGGIIGSVVYGSVVNCAYRGMIECDDLAESQKDRIVGGIVGRVSDCEKEEHENESFTIKNSYYLNEFPSTDLDGYIGINEHLGINVSVNNCCKPKYMKSQEKMEQLNRWVEEHQEENIFREWKLGEDGFLLLGVEPGQEYPVVPVGPRETVVPSETNVPSETKAPVETNAPSETKVPVETILPTEKAVETPIPQTTEQPLKTSAPDITKAPDATEQPIVAKKDSKKEKTKKKSKTLKAPTLKISKGKLRGVSYLQIHLKKYEGTNVEIYMAVAKKFVKVRLKSSKISKYKGKIRLTYKAKGKKLSCKVRTWKKKNGKKIYSNYSKVYKIKI